MSRAESSTVLLSSAIEKPLLDFRRALRRTKLAESILASLFFFGLAYWIVFALDRCCETGVLLRCIALFLGVLCCLTAIPWTLHKWVWGTRKLTAVARKLRPAFPRLSEQILSIIELSSIDRPQTGSPVLIAAAMQQVERKIGSVDFMEGIPSPRLRHWLCAALVPWLVAAVLAITFPSLAWNVLLRFSQPWLGTPRFTFTRLVPMLEETVVPYAEPFALKVRVDPSSLRLPEAATGWLNSSFILGSQESEGDGTTYTFQLPGQTEPILLDIRCGDAFAKTRIVPTIRPELTTLRAKVELPDYLQYDTPMDIDLRSGVVSILQGSQVELSARGNRLLRQASWNGNEVPVVDGGILLPKQSIDQSMTISLDWQDEIGLRAAAPMSIKLRTNTDRGPTVACSKWPAIPVWLATDTLRFEVSAEDDFGLKHIGIEWIGINEASTEDNATRGERLVVAGASQQKSLSGTATLSCEIESIRPQLLQIRAFTQDYLPGRERVYSIPYLIQMMTPEEHSQWLSQQLRRWRSRADAIYDEELRLLDENRELRKMESNANGQESTRNQILKQSKDERVNSQKLGSTVEEGRRLLEQALRNEEIRSQQVESWARALERLNGIAETRMPSVANQLEQAANSGDRGSSLSKSPSLNDRQASQAKVPPTSNTADGKPSKGRLSIPEVVLGPDGREQKENKPKEDEQADRKNTVPSDLDNAVRDQSDLIDEFRKAREQFDELMSDFENSTFIKRFKSASRLEKEIARQVNQMIGKNFGKKAAQLETAQKRELEPLRLQLLVASEFLRSLQSDLEAYQADVPSSNREAVLKEMVDRNVLVKLGEMSERMDRNLRGDVLHRSEYWADTFDRWAEELAGPAKPGGGGGDEKEKESLPPALLLEIMRIIGDEIDLRDETRTLDQLHGKSTSIVDASEDVKDRATGLAVQQMDIQERTLNVSQDIRALPNAMKNFDKELGKLKKAVQAMDDASAFLTDWNVGPQTNAAQTAAIEALLEARRSGGGGNGEGGTGGGSMASGTTRRLPMDLVGPSRDANARIAPRQVGEGVGKTGKQLPEEFREGLDSIFNELSRLQLAPLPAATVPPKRGDGE